jgi:hypothetical protein
VSVEEFLGRVSASILNPIIILLFFIAVLVFFWGIFQFVGNAAESSEREGGKKKIMYGLIGMFIMFSAYGLVRVVLDTFGIRPPTYIQNRL